MRRRRTTARTILFLVFAWALAGSANAAVPRIVFPVVAQVSYTNDFGAPRGQGRHQGNDLMARKKARVVAAETGRVVKWTRSARAGCMLYLHGRSGTTYMYVHLNNDRTMRNDTHNNSTCRNGIAYAPGLATGDRVQAGQLIGYVGDSGDADGIAAHLHFELHPKGRGAVSPYKKLRAAYHLLYQRPAATAALTARIAGTVVWVSQNLEPDRMRIRVGLVKLSNGWGVRPARDLVVAVPADATVRRETGGGTAAASLSQAKAGDRVTITTTSFAQTFAYARAPAGLHRTADVLFGG